MQERERGGGLWRQGLDYGGGGTLETGTGGWWWESGRQ